MGRYVTNAEANTYLGLSCDDSSMSAFVAGAEAMVDNYVGMSLTENSSYYEEREYPANTLNGNVKYGREIYLNGINPHGTLKIDTVSISASDFRFIGNKLILKDSVTLQTTFPYLNKYEYTTGYATIPDDVKQACYLIIGELNATKNSGGISSFRQDMLYVTYDKGSKFSSILSPDKMNEFALLLNKYKTIGMVSSGIDRGTIPGIY